MTDHKRKDWLEAEEKRLENLLIMRKSVEDAAKELGRDTDDVLNKCYELNLVVRAHPI